MKIVSFILFLYISFSASSQPFSELIKSGFTFTGSENSTAGFVDVDNDGDEDLFHGGVFYKNNNQNGFSSFFYFCKCK